MTNPFEPPADEPQATPPAGGPPPYGQSPPPYGQPAYGQPGYGQSPPLYGQPPMSPAPYGQPPYGSHPMMMRNGLGTAALVLGIVGAVSGLFMVLFFIAFILGVLAVIFGLVGRGRAKRGEASNKTMATWGFALGVVSLVLAVVGLAVVVHVSNDRQNCRAQATSQDEYLHCNSIW